MVISVVHDGRRQRGVVVVAAEQAVLLVAQADADLARLALFHRPSFAVQKLHIIEGRGPAHRAGPDLHVFRKGAAHHRRLRLAEPFIDEVARLHADLAVDLGVERFARRHHEFDGREVVLGEVGLHHKAVHGGGSAEGGDAVFGDVLHQRVRLELAVEVVHKDGGTAQPLPEQLAPARLRPARLGEGEVQAVVHAVEPEAGGDDVPQRIALRQGDHLGHARGAGSEVYEQDVVRGALRLIGDAQLVAALFRLGGVVDKSFPLADGGGAAHAGHFAHRLQDVAAQLVFVDGYDHLDLRLVHAVHEVLFHQHVRGGDGDGADLGKRHQRRPVFVAALQNDQHRVALADAVL